MMPSTPVSTSSPMPASGPGAMLNSLPSTTPPPTPDDPSPPQALNHAGTLAAPAVRKT
jgi:hypothetical protein